MLEYVGNFDFWISDRWVDEILKAEGIKKPNKSEILSDYEQRDYDKLVELGYNLNYPMWEIYQKRHVSFDIINPPWVTENNINWWITKLLPGNIMPLHRDPHTIYDKSKRFWIPLQDYQPGHIFMYKDSVITDYKKGDVYSYQDSTDIHGAANIGFTPRVVLQITEFIE